MDISIKNLLQITPPAVILAELHGAAITARTLFERLGLEKTLKVFATVARAQAAGEPWQDMPRPADAKDKLSRRQLGSAVLLERALRDVTSPEEARPELARAITREIVLKASVSFLNQNVPQLKKKKVLAMSQKQREKFILEIQEKFFNADADLEFRYEEELFLTVRRCRFVELLQDIGEEDMAPIFCEGDRIFFDQHQPETIFTRPETLSTGGTCCDFRFKWK